MLSDADQSQDKCYVLGCVFAYQSSERWRN